MLPENKQNIYPRNKENIRALLNFYFKIPDGDIEFLFEQSKLELNQIEFIAKQVSNNLYYLETEIGANGLTISNVMNYGLDAVSKFEGEWRGSKNRIRITKKLKELILNNDYQKFKDN